MAYIRINVNPCKNRTIDCTVRALCALFDSDWETVYAQLCTLGYEMCDMPSSKAVLNRYMAERGYTRHICPDITVKEFAEEYPDNAYLLAAESHVIPVFYGYYIDTWDSGQLTCLYYWKKGA